jgi:rhodanese-related sulfurtransferase
MKVNVINCLIILLVSSVLGLLYNYINPAGIKLIPVKKEIKWASDSIVSSGVIKDTIKNNLTVKALISDKPFRVSQETKTFKTGTKTEIKSKTDTKVNIDSEGDDGFKEPLAINLEQAHKLYETGIIFIDARDVSEYKTGHIRNSINLSVYDFDKFKNVMTKIPKSQTIICYCGGSDCDLSKSLAEKLFSIGYRNSYIFIGGWEEWKSAGYPIE